MTGSLLPNDVLHFHVAFCAVVTDKRNHGS